MTANLFSRLECTGCGASPTATDPYPFCCPNAGRGDVDHVLARVLDLRRVSFPTGSTESCPFIRYRQLLHSYHRARAGGIGDDDFVDLVRRLDAAVAEVDGHGFVCTPFDRNEDLSLALGFRGEGGVWVKDETGNVSGSHKARHLMGVLLHLEVSEMLGLTDRRLRPVLSVASCGNAALAAAVVAAAGGWTLRVFVPVDADPVVVDRLRALQAQIVVCERRSGDAGDPAYRRLLQDLQEGSIAFTCQGNLNGLAIEGGETLGYELASDLSERRLDVDHLVVQVGGGALASSCGQALSEARSLGALAKAARLHTVQTASAHPLERAYQKIAGQLPERPQGADVDDALAAAATHRSAYMWPWETVPDSMATGILDDETYDWLAVVRAMLSTGGRPVVVTERQLARAHGLGRQAGFRADPTGTAGLAGLMELIESGGIEPHERVVVLFTGVERS